MFLIMESIQETLTYIDDIVNGIVNSIKLKTKYKYEIFNLGNSKSIGLKKIIKILGNNYKRQVKIRYLDLQKGDIKDTRSNISKAKNTQNIFQRQILRKD